MKNWKGIVLGIVIILLLGMTNTGGTNAYQGMLSNDGRILVVIDTRTGGYKVRRVSIGEYEIELFSAKERALLNYNYRNRK